MKRRLVFSLSCLALAACGPRQNRDSIQNKGSDTLFPAAQAWAEAYRKVKPDVVIAVAGGGSGTGISAMINGTVDIANCSREMKDSEVEMAKKRGHVPKEHVVGYDAIVIFVHKDNPLESITLPQLKAILGEGGDIQKWSQLGVKLPGADKDPKKDEIVRVGRQNSSGTYAYFREAVLGKNADYKLNSRDLHGSKEVVEFVGKTVVSIGYSSMAFADEHVKMLPVAQEEGGRAVSPSIDSAIDGSYPIARPLLMYTAGDPVGQVKEYLDWILSDTGQRILVGLGYPPVRKLD